MNVAVLLAGGKGSRVDLETPKQYINVSNHQVIEYALKAFSASSNIHEILIVSHIDYVSEIEKFKKPYKKLKYIISGGGTRILSVFNAIEFLNSKLSDADNVVFSDAARPCITIKEIDAVLESLNEHLAVTSGLECYETILKVDNGDIKDVINRDALIRQTSPEGYKFSVLKGLYLNQPKDVLTSYKNIGIDQLFAQGIKIGIIKSNPLNFKITTPIDLKLFESIVKLDFDKLISQ